MKQRILPLGENVLIQPDKTAEKTSEGIYLPDTANEKRSKFGNIIAVGKSKDIKVKVGDKVIFRLYGGEEVSLADEKYLLTSYKDILAVVSEK